MPDGFDTIEDSLTRSRTIIDALRAEVKALKAKLERHTAPLTDEQMAEAAAIWERVEDDGTDYGNVRDWDAAIRQVRGSSKEGSDA